MRDFSPEEEAIIRRFRRCCKTLSKIREDWRKIHPEGGLYNTPDSLNLMTGPSHDGDETSGWGAGGRLCRKTWRKSAL